MKKFLKHFGYYSSMILIFTLGFLASTVSYPNLPLVFTVLILTVVFYVIWGIAHHKINHDLSTKILLEYLLIGFLGISIIFFIIVGGKV
ncbi:MAG: hypothetical protein A2798_01580 [Candidatus Levybacteria bacterium RIFCSPHIGHO2_01_FULL_37_17]|nr:MAG: hypothetical protein A2798_01580 [Candidatus Levybacteria bacterium RIFCSPHIGHO2_01_FULL_37_17]OGH37140.1 MAG: hypothetical protein A2959_02440 [Candidatus Levybacteria bacterium RIFCSPLOWO2_01_FULL_38_23]